MIQAIFKRVSNDQKIIHENFNAIIHHICNDFDNVQCWMVDGM